jgi:hypothetical protein
MKKSYNAGATHRYHGGEKHRWVPHASRNGRKQILDD